VIAFGSFSMMHPGHLTYLEEARKLGNHLVVVLTTDRNILKEKGRPPVFNEAERKHLVSSLKFVDEVLIGSEGDFLAIVRKVNPDVIALGYDSRYDEKKLEKGLADLGLRAKVRRIRKFTGHRTREIIRKIKDCPPCQDLPAN
jgi:FAD synthetase